tara:strand:- start:1311 stop:2135 length:825 start_codon:yes stop_codon:yes gene_type:complete
MPTAQTGHSHIGHLWALLNNIFLAHRIDQLNYMFYAPKILEKNISINWTLFIDNQFQEKTQFEDSYQQMMRWVGLNPDVIRLCDFRSEMMGNNNGPVTALLNRQEKNNIELSHAFWKLFFFHITHTCWHIRGEDLRTLNDNEIIIANAFGLNLPTYYYIDILDDENGEKIEAEKVFDGTQSNQYAMSDLFNENPFNVIKGLLKSMRIPQKYFIGANEFIDSPSAYTSAGFRDKVRWINNILYPTWSEYGRAGKCPTADLFDQTCIPENWRNYIQ